MSAGFTPGPWRVDDRRDRNGFLQVQAQHRGEGSSYCVASVNFWEAPEANARLIAAAPEPYEDNQRALSFFADLNGCDWIKGDDVGAIDMRQRAKAMQRRLFANAAKARGEA